MKGTFIRLSGSPFFWVGYEQRNGRYTSTKYGSQDTVRLWMKARCGSGFEWVRQPKEAWADETYLLKSKTTSNTQT